MAYTQPPQTQPNWANHDLSLGPRIPPTIRAFDFTLTFEDIILTCLPTALFLVSWVFCVGFDSGGGLKRLGNRRGVGWLGGGKLVTLTSLLVVQVVFLAFRAGAGRRGDVVETNTKTRASIAANILSVAATAAAIVLSYLTHRRSSRPSTLLILHLSASSILSIARTRTFWLISHGPLAILMTVSTALTVFALVLESIEEKTGSRRRVTITLDGRLDEKETAKGCAPEESSGFWSRVCFVWLGPTFWMGYEKVFGVEELPALDTKLGSRVLRDRFMETWGKYNHRGRHSLLRACFRSYFLSCISPVIPKLCVVTFTFGQPVLINATVSYISQSDPDIDYGKGLIGGWAIVYLGLAVSNSTYQYQNFRFMTRLRGGLNALVYQRTMQTREADRGEITAIALMGTDIECIVQGMQLFHEMWSSLLSIGIASYLLGQQLFLACLAPIILVAAFSFINLWVSLLATIAQRRWVEKVQKRLRVTSILLGDIKAVKMLDLTDVMFRIIQTLRMDEIKTSKVFRNIFVVTLLLSLTTTNLAPVVTFAVYVLISVLGKNDTLLTAQAFTSIALITLLTTPVVVFIQAVLMFMRCIASFDRIQEYCNYSTTETKSIDTNKARNKPESETNPRSTTPDTDTSPLLPKQPLSFSHESFGWDQNKPAILKDLKVDLKRGGITAIVGPVGSGKSAFLNSLLGEMVSMSLVPVHKEMRKEVTWKTESMAYCSQQPWLENKTIRENIVGPNSWDKEWYDRVVAACGLRVDVGGLVEGDGTGVGSWGVNVSGGQKQRIALARAIYARKSIVILDDVFSGMDAHTVDIVSSRLLGPNGLLRENHTTAILATHSYKIMSFADIIIVLEDGKILETGSPNTLLLGDGYVAKLGLSFTFSQERTEKALDDVDLEVSLVEESAKSMKKSDYLLTDIRRKNGDLSVYKYYMAKAGYIVVGMYVAAVVLWILCSEFTNVWVKWWAEANTNNPNKDVGLYIGIYVMLGILGSIGASLAVWFVFIPIISHTAANMHSDLLIATLEAPFRFFTATDSGELLNRFGQDMELIDMDLPSALVNYTSTAVSVLVKIVILAIFSHYLGVIIPFLGIVLYFLQRFYLHTSGQVRLLGIEARAPLYTHFTESVTGASTIRAFGWQTHYQETNCRHIDTLQRPLYIQSCIQAWLAFAVNIIVAVLAVILVVIVIIGREKFSAGSVGVSLVMVIGLSETLARLIQSWTKLESSVGAVSRVKWFTDETESDESLNRTGEVPLAWPQAGALDFKNVIASYTHNSDPVLKDVSISIEPKQHIAICGRSGSGKTSLILSLLQMISINRGTITLDNIDISTISSSDLRAYINVVPQDPFLIPGTIRFNIDPSFTVSGEEIITALERVGLWGVVEEQGGLDVELDAAAWSAGQRQLLCFARAMVGRCKVLVLDESMSSVDTETESLMQEIVDTEFRDCTVLAVMHHLRHVARYDKVALMGDGKLLEYDDPKILMAGNTRFGELVRLNAS